MLVSVIQHNAGKEHSINVNRALELVDRAAEAGAKFVLLPEYSTFWGSNELYAANAETVPGPTSDAMAAKARKYGITIQLGSLIESAGRTDKFYNTSLLFNPNGELIASYRKVHLFDVDVPGKVTDSESSVIIPGDHLVAVKLPEFYLGMSICFDLRFPELYRALALSGAEVLTIPSAFARGTGEAHWHVLVRARAIENHAYVLAAGQYGTDSSGGFYSFGHSMIVNPWGEILAEAPAEEEAVLVADIDIEEVRRRREQIPVLNVGKPDAYKNIEKK
jgi:deaminated glutathione amidase